MILSNTWRRRGRGKKNHIYTNEWQEVEEGVPLRSAEESLKAFGKRGQTDGSMTPVGCMWWRLARMLIQDTGNCGEDILMEILAYMQAPANETNGAQLSEWNFKAPFKIIPFCLPRKTHNTQNNTGLQIQQAGCAGVATCVQSMPVC